MGPPKAVQLNICGASQHPTHGGVWHIGLGFPATKVWHTWKEFYKTTFLDAGLPSPKKFPFLI